MKKITILRHAKSDWSAGDSSDHNRELNHRGLRDREIMASVMEKNNIRPELILCSTATRVRKTIATVAKDEWLPSEKIVFSPQLYLASESTICTEIATIDDSYSHILVCGHNPGLTDFVNAHTDLSITNLPTCGLVSATFHIDTWADIFSSRGSTEFHLWPKLFT